MSATKDLNIGPTAFWLDLVNALVIALLFGLAIYYYNQLPAEIPIRFDAKGAPIASRTKATLFVFPVMALFISFIMFFIRRQPDMINYPVKVTDENEQALYQQTSQLVSGILLVTNVMLLLVCWKIVQIAMEKSQDLNTVYLWMPIILIVLLAVNAYRRMKQLG
jgi:uncharacterized membrane protein